jgi:hypothetical protein
MQTQGNLAIMPITPISNEKIDLYSNNANQLLEIAKQQKAISSSEQLQVVGTEVLRIKDVRKQVQELFADPKKQAHETHKSICEAEKKLLDPLDQAEKAYNQMILNYNREQQRLLALEQERIRKEAEAKAEVERQAKLKEAEAAMDNGADLSQIEEMMAEAETVIPIVPIIQTAQSIPVGLNIKQNWTWECIDINLVPREYLMLDEKKLNAQAKATKDTVKVPGIRFYDEGTVAKSR